jgi:hypothetical protein
LSAFLELESARATDRAQLPNSGALCRVNRCAGSRVSDRARHWLAKSNEAAGNKDKAEALYKDISMYNFNGIDYALIRNEVMNRKPPM